MASSAWCIGGDGAGGGRRDGNDRHERFDHWPALKCFSVFHDNATWWLQICSLSFIVVHYNVQWPRYFSKRLQLSTMPTLTFQLHPHIEAFLESEITRLVVGGGNFEHSGQHPRDEYINLLNIIKMPGMMMMIMMIMTLMKKPRHCTCNKGSASSASCL